jgi:hypothetical protein
MKANRELVPFTPDYKVEDLSMRIRVSITFGSVSVLK